MLGDAIEDQFELVIARLANLLTALGVLVVKDMVSAELLHEVEVVRRCSCKDLCA